MTAGDLSRGGTDQVDDIVAATDPAMVVVTVAAGSALGGCLVGFHCQTSINPFRYGVWISRSNHTYTLVRGAAFLAVHFLTPRNHVLASLFGAETGDETDKFETIAWSPHHRTGVPILGDVDAILVGRTVGLVETDGDHLLVTLEPVESRVGEGRARPLRLRDVSDLSPGHEPGERR